MPRAPFCLGLHRNFFLALQVGSMNHNLIVDPGSESVLANHKTYFERLAGHNFGG